ncbi:hypothetical protein FEM48_Zijuj09G0039900 [Ziziphus jujuba var. spinosa]|uniref:Terpene synthase N-terminal domain-containing protein n=1 Tax=Ziziphus jujuba var. spinosa TaxID=714518 RepID=A0A978UQS2_ZIZJJ|nr:hypothetical protein FEM48_Zijuj09G0039900 [Ziziphus jujuba var. spinosa]
MRKTHYLFHIGVWSFGTKDKRGNLEFHTKCNAISKPRTQEYASVLQNGLPVIKWPEIVEDDIEGEARKIGRRNEIKERVESIKSKLASMDDGEISVSAYDTAWVALVEDIHGSGTPQFPSSLQWIANNQLPDGSWGDCEIFSAHDRIINTLACVVALKSWNVHPDKCHKGMEFLKENISRLRNENTEHMPIGFEVAFPSLLEIARKIDLQIPDDSPILQEIYAKRDLKLTRIPRDIMHRVPTTLLHSLEGMAGLDWEKLLKLQSRDGSFLFSPSSTAFALMETKDLNCFKYLNNAVQKFNGGVPNVYPVDLFEHIWVVDRLQRLGISRFFEPEIKECIDYVSRYWTDKGICWARNSEVRDIDDTAMAFKLLRLHGRKVSADVFENFKKGDEFFCFAGQSSQAVTGMFNLFRASQLLFPGEKILEDAKYFSSKFLRQKQASNELLDKWIIMKDLPGEVGYALEVPWYASLPRVETRFYIQQYGAEHDVWIGKTLYRMANVSNNEYLELAKLDYNNCQAVHSEEWDKMQRWYSECKLGDFGLSRRSLLMAYFLAVANIFEAERVTERLAWAKTSALIHTIASQFHIQQTTRTAFVNEFRTSNNMRDYVISRRWNTNKKGHGLVKALLGTLNHLSLDTLIEHGQDICGQLRQAWEKWLLKWEEAGDSHQGEAELLVQTLNLSAGRTITEGQVSSNPQYEQLFNITNRVCGALRIYQTQKHRQVNY